MGGHQHALTQPDPEPPLGGERGGPEHVTVAEFPHAREQWPRPRRRRNTRATTSPVDLHSSPRCRGQQEKWSGIRKEASPTCGVGYARH